jgi:glycosyltransferase involved in cell wall biosynthesis
VLSVVVLTLNEARHITDCLKSVQAIADEFVVFDSHSVDATCQLAEEAGAKVVERDFDNFPGMRNAALEGVQGDWVFFLDADERVTPAIGNEIRDAIARSDSQPNGPVLFWIPRRNYIFGHLIQHTGWSPDYQPRVLKKGRARFDPTRQVHELVLAEGGEEFLRERLTHYNYESVSQFLRKQRRYTQFEARILFEQGIRPRWRGLVGQPLREFIRRLITLQGYKDGGYGILLSALMAYYAFVRQRMLAEMYQRRGPN